MEELTVKERFRRQQEDLDKRLNALSEKDLPTANIIVAGITGAGKSTLLNAVFGSELAKTGSGRPVTDHINEYNNDEIPVRIWDTVGLELNAEKTKKSIQSIKDVIAKKAAEKDQFDRIHAIWYCINSASSRYQGAELAFIKELHEIDVPFIIVLTQCIAAKKKITAFEEEIKKINKQEGMTDISIVRVLAKDDEVEIDEDHTVPKPAFGLDDLVEETLKQLPTFIKSGFIAAQRVSEGQKRIQCEEIIYEFAKAAQEGFWDHVPLINIFTTDKKIIRMLEKIGRIYNTVLSEKSVDKVISESDVDFENNFWGLVSPVDFVGYNDKINALLDRKKKDGFDVKAVDIPKNDRAARMIAFYGYTFTDSIEELWKKLTQEQLEDVDMVVDNLIVIINRKLRERKTKRKG